MLRKGYMQTELNAGYRTEFHPPETLGSRREKLMQKQKAWKEDIVNDADLYEMMGNEYFDLHDIPSPLELTMLYQSLCGPGQESEATPKQLIQLLHSTDPGIALFSLKQVAAKMEQGVMDINHLTTAIEPMIQIVLNGDQRHEVYWAVLFVLQQLCIEDRHAMMIGDIGGSRVLIALIEVDHKPSKEYESVNHTVISNILNALWLICCYEGNGDLSSYDESEGPITSLLVLLKQLREDSTLMLLPPQKALRQEFMGTDQMVDDLASDDAILVLLQTLEKLSLLKVYRGLITSAGGIEQCVPLLTAQKWDHRTTAATIIKNLMVDNSLEFVVLGGIQNTMPMLASQDEAEHLIALKLFLHIFKVRGDLTSTSTDMVSCGCLAVCSALLQSQTKEVARAAISLLGLICRHGPEDYSYLLAQEPGLVEGVVALLRDSHIHTVQQASAMYWYLTRIEATHQHLINSGSIPLLKELLTRCPDPVVRHNVAGCLTKLDCFDYLTDDLLMSPQHEQMIHW